jgi:hypothetical protein
MLRFLANCSPRPSYASKTQRPRTRTADLVELAFPQWSLCMVGWMAKKSRVAANLLSHLAFGWMCCHPLQYCPSRERVQEQ